ncbi:hypothetical protein PG985_013127 [Apiospora marii]|uniref:uncharacterized protein n=1 Tax=Apiospora marii TaxID=335849 RepID=UPI003130D537
MAQPVDTVDWGMINATHPTHPEVRIDLPPLPAILPGLLQSGVADSLTHAVSQTPHVPLVGTTPNASSDRLLYNLLGQFVGLLLGGLGVGDGESGLGLQGPDCGLVGIGKVLLRRRTSAWSRNHSQRKRLRFTTPHRPDTAFGTQWLQTANAAPVWANSLTPSALSPDAATRVQVGGGDGALVVSGAAGSMVMVLFPDVEA